MKKLNKQIGYYGEQLCENYLISIGYNILCRNFSCKVGEIDIIARDKSFICFIEVKTRYNNIYGVPCESVIGAKEYKIFRVAQYYINKYNLHKNYFRFDVAEVCLNHHNDDCKINIIKDAFQFTY